MRYIDYSQEYDDQVISLWNKALFFDPININIYRDKVLLDENFDPKLCLLAVDGEDLVGYILGIKRKFPYMEKGLQEDTGWISVMFVDKNYRRQGIGTRLYKEVEARLRERGVQKIILAAYSPNYFFGGVDEENYPEAKGFFAKMGYTSGNYHYSMGMDLSGFRLNEKIKQKMELLNEKGYRFTNFDYSRALELLEFLKDEFGGGWKRNALLAMRNRTAEDVIILVIDKNDRICGFSMRAIDGNPERFGPIGIAKDKRNEGIGSVLLNYSFDQMRKNNIDHMFFMTTDDAGRRYYERNGLSLIRTVKEYNKQFY